MWWRMRRNQISSFGRKGWVHLNQRGRRFSRLLAAEVCESAVVMLGTPCSEVVWRVLATQFASFPFTSPPVRQSVPSHFNWTLIQFTIKMFNIRFYASYANNKGPTGKNLQLTKRPCWSYWKQMQPFGLTIYVKPSNWRQNIATSKSREITDKAGAAEKQQPNMEQNKKSNFCSVKNINF